VRNIFHDLIEEYCELEKAQEEKPDKPFWCEKDDLYDLYVLMREDQKRKPRSKDGFFRWVNALPGVKSVNHYSPFTRTTRLAGGKTKAPRRVTGLRLTEAAFKRLGRRDPTADVEAGLIP